MNGHLLEASDIEYAYHGGECALQGFSLRIAAGDRIAVLGSNGAGKSTLLLLLSGLLPVRKGSLSIEGTPYRRRRHARIAPHDRPTTCRIPTTNFASTVEQDVAFGLVQRDVSEDEAFARAAAVLERLGIASLAKRQVRSLSLGQRKRLALAGLVVLKPALLLLDEPTAGLDHGAIASLVSVLDELQSDGAAILLSTHDADFAARWASRTVILDGGRMVGQGPVERVLSATDLLARAGLSMPTTYAAALALAEVYPACRQWPLPRSIEELRQFIRRIGATSEAREESVEAGRP